MNKKYSFDISTKKIHIEYIYGSIHISNIENYLKSIEELQNQEKKLDIVIVPNKHVYDDVQLFWTVFIAKNRFEDKINVSKTLQKETLLLLSLTDQINKVDPSFEITSGENNYFIYFVYEGNINLKDIIKKLKINVKTEIAYNKQEAKEYYKIREPYNTINKIIEKISSV